MGCGQPISLDCLGLLITPCDAPFLPLNLAAVLKREAKVQAMPGALASYQSEAQPTFSIWHRSILPQLETAVLELGMSGFKQFLVHRPLALVEWEASDISPFFNINDRKALDQAESLIQSVK